MMIEAFPEAAAAKLLYIPPYSPDLNRAREVTCARAIDGVRRFDAKKAPGATRA
jgi:transposase